MSLLRLSSRVVLSLIIVLPSGWLTYSQSTNGTTVGVQKFGAYDGFPDTVDVGSLGVNLNISLFHKSGRGSNTALDISLQNFNMGSNWPTPYVVSPSGGQYLFLGPSISFGVTAAGQATSTGQTHNCVSQGSLTYTDYTWTYLDSQGNTHLFPGTSRVANTSNSTCANAGFVTTNLTAQASDGSGYLINVTGAGPATITDPSGGSMSSANGRASAGDSNGNFIGISTLTTDTYGNIFNYVIQDTVGTTLHISGGGWATDYSNRQPLLITYLDDSGNTQTITASFKAYPYTSGSSSPSSLMDTLTYPDGSAFHFTYVFASSGAPLGIGSITLPSGGVISYGYPSGINLCGGGYPNWIPSLTRTTSDGTTTYTRTITSYTAQANDYCHIATSWTQISKPNGDQTNVYFVVPQHYAVNPAFSNVPGWIPDWGKTMETKRIVYDHSNLSAPVRTTMVCYNGNTGDCTSAGFNEPVNQLAITTTLDNGLSSQIVTQYTGSLPSEVDEYDFGASTLTRKTVTSYATLSNNISDRPASVIVYDSAGNAAKKTTYVYDETTPAAMTLPGHTTASGSRGNPTSVYQWIVSSNQSLRKQVAYDDAGQVTAMTDPNLNITSYAYDTATDAYLTKITRPTTNSVAHVSTFSYGPNSDRVTSAYDENNQLTSFVYDSMFRPSSVTYADGGQTTFAYTPNSRTTNRLQQSGVWSTNVEQYDSYGRIAQTQLSGPDITTTTSGATTYDSLGRVQNIYNPTRCNPPTTNCGESTWGVTSYQYDALNRTKQVTQPDGNTLVFNYTGRATQAQDEGNGSQRVTRITQKDALGRLSSVCEVASGPFVGTGGTQSSSLIGSGGTPGSCGQDIPGTGFVTTYTYDLLDNLTQVNQSGVGQRNFGHDSLSRLISATNPESGSTTYSYDNNSNVLTKTDSRGITTCFGTWTGTTCNSGYDALNRVLQKTYSDGTPGVSNTYDSASVDGLTLSNPVGRLVKTKTNDGLTATVNSYNQLGRVNNQWQCTPQNCGSYYFSLPYGYDFLGNITSAGNGLGVTIGYGLNSASQLISVTSSLSDGTHPPTLLSNVTYNPPGEMTAATLGNGATESFGYDSRVRLQNISTNGGTGSSGSATISGNEQSIPGAPATAGTGSVTFSGTLQSKQVQTQSAAPGTGTVIIGGAEQSIPTNPAAPGTGWATVTGSDGTETHCSVINQRTGNCIQWITGPDAGYFILSVNNVFAQVPYGSSSTSASLASALVTAINGSSSYPVTASLSGTTLYLTAKTSGASTNYSLSGGRRSNYPSSTNGFAFTFSGASLTGGHDTIPAVYDSGKVTITVNGFTGSYTYGQNDNSSSVALALANSLASSSVNASASGGTITLVAKTNGSATNYPLSATVSYDNTHFSGPSFTATPSSSALTGGQDAAYKTVYDSGTSTITVNNHGTSFSWSGSSTTTTSIASGLASNINADSAAFVTATPSGSTINLTAKTTGLNTNYSLSSSSTYDSTDFSSASFSSSNSGSALIGGHDAGATTYDSGSVWITVNGAQYSVNYGQSSTTSSLATSLAQAINGANGPVSATATSATVSLASREGGLSTNYSLSVGSSTAQSSSFSQPSFTLSASGSTMTGGATGNVTNVYSLSLAYSPNSSVNTANDSVNGNWAYGYDPFNRVVSANQNNGQAVYSYVYDIAGNRWQQNGPNTMTLSFTGNNSTNNNRADGYGYDSAGNLLSDGSYCYAYDAENRIAQITLPPCGNGSVVATYLYDGYGNRVRKTASIGTVDFLYDSRGNQVAQVNSAGSWIRGEVYAGSRHLATYWNGTTYFNHTDWLGTERLRSNLSGLSCETITNLPFGDALAMSGSCTDASPMHFTGQEHESESSLDNFGTRHFSSNMGRFISADPANAGASDENPQSWNAYTYVANNPINDIDPDGLTGQEPCNKQNDPNCGDKPQPIHTTVKVSADAPPREPVSAAKIADTWENAGRVAQSMWDATRMWLSTPRNMSCLVGGTLAGANVGLRAGAAVGLAGGPLSEVSVPGGAITGAVIGGGVGWAAGMSACKTGAGGGGGGGSGSGGSSSGGSAKSWKFGSNKSATQWANQMKARGWTEAQIDEAIEKGAQYPAVNNINSANGATRFVSPTTGQSVVMDNATREVIHIGGPGFRY